MTVMIWRVTASGKVLLEVDYTYNNDRHAWERAMSFIPNWGIIKIRADWQGIHIITGY